ncbi:hypothetical protein WJX79_010581 [Trebouxia sp. C0005]|nr:MAG: photosystem II reaction center W [Trebouxia sp. A1-2]
MQAVCSTSATGVKSLSVTRSAGRSVRTCVPARVVCKAQVAKAPIAAAAASLTSLIAAHPAFALVDDRLGGEGTGKILGVGGIEGWAIIGVFTAIWAAYYASQKDLGGDKTDDSGLGL